MIHNSCIIVQRLIVFLLDICGTSCYEYYCSRVRYSSVLLDNGSTVNSFANGEMLENIRVSRNPIVMSTNVGSKEINLEADLYGFGTVYYDAGQMANILGFAPMVDKGYRIQCWTL